MEWGLPMIHSALYALKRLNTTFGLTLLLCISLVGGEPKVPLPTDKEQEEPAKLLKEIFKEEYAKNTADAKATLAKKLLGQASETNDSLATKYVLLNEARALAIQGKDLDTVLKAIEEL